MENVNKLTFLSQKIIINTINTIMTKIYNLNNWKTTTTLNCPWLENLGLALNEQIRVFNVQNLVESLVV